MRVPFPVKVFLSYLAVLLAGAVPIYVYIQTSFQNQMLMGRVQETAGEVTALAADLRDRPSTGRQARVADVAKVIDSRVTYIGSSGVALFDSAAKSESLGNLAMRPEVRAALGQTTTGTRLDMRIPGVGADRRVSRATGQNTLFVAARLDEETPSEVVRIGLDYGVVHELAATLQQVLRNSQAAALSLALLLSALAAFVFMRPLQRLLKSAKAMSAGDYTASQTWQGTDEIGDVGLALNHLAMELRQRLATAQAAETLLVQAGEFLSAPLAIVERNGSIVMINGEFRRLVEDETTDAEDVVARLLGSKKYAKTYRAARGGDHDGVMHWTRKRIGMALRMHLLERPGREPLMLLTVHDAPPDSSPLPNPGDTRVKELDELMQVAVRRAQVRREKCTFEVDYLDQNVGDTPVAEVDERVAMALTAFLEASARGQSSVHVCAEVDGTHVEVWVDGETGTAPLRLLRALLEPCGGDVVDRDNISLRIPRA